MGHGVDENFRVYSSSCTEDGDAVGCAKTDDGGTSESVRGDRSGEESDEGDAKGQELAADVICCVDLIAEVPSVAAATVPVEIEGLG